VWIPCSPGPEQWRDVRDEDGVLDLACQVSLELRTADPVPCLTHVAREAGRDPRRVCALLERNQTSKSSRPFFRW
jgi:hypothetical protein